MGEAAATIVLCACTAVAILALDRLARWADGRKTPEQRKAEERWQWKHGGWS